MAFAPVKRLLGWLAKAAGATATASLPYPYNIGWPIVREPFTGAWQQNMEVRCESVLTFGAVYSCVTLIANDISKLALQLQEKQESGVWIEIESPAFSPVLRKPNHWQTHIQFYEQWILSKLLYGNTYVLKERDLRGVVIGLYVLDPNRTRVMIAPNGELFYQLSRDDLAGVAEQVTVPAREIIHDRMAPLYHGVCGVSPIVACGNAALQGLRIQSSSLDLFGNAARPGGVLSAPGRIDDENAKRVKEYWENNFTGANRGKVAVLGDGLKWEAMTMTSVDAQLIEQLKWSAETVASCFHVPPYKIGIGAIPVGSNVESINTEYYSQCLQHLMESIEILLNEGLGLVDVTGRELGTRFDLDGLLRMDTATKSKTWGDLVKGGIATPNEARAKFDKEPVEGGDTPYLQQQNYGLAALAKRDAQDDPFATKTPAAPTGGPDNSANGDGGDNPADNPDGGGTNDQAANKAINDFRRRIRSELDLAPSA